MTKNIIFDFGGVLVKLDKDICTREFAKIDAEAVGHYVDYCIQEDFFHELEVGAIDIAGFCKAVREKAPQCTGTDRQIVEAWESLLTEVPVERLRRILELKKTHRIFLLSNTNIIHWRMAEDFFFRQIEGLSVDDYFEKAYLSYKLGMIKPDKEIFNILLRENSLNPSETVFIDDSPKNCAAAEAVGIRAFHAPKGDEWMEEEF